MSGLPHHGDGVPRPAACSVALGDPSPGADLRRVREGVAQGVASGRGLQLDLSQVVVLSSPTVATILWAQRRCVARNLPFSVTAAQGRTRRILATCGLPERGTARRW